MALAKVLINNITLESIAGVEVGISGNFQVNHCTHSLDCLLFD